MLTSIGKRLYRAVTLLLLFVVTCSDGEAMDLRGRLIYSSGGNAIEALNLQSLKTEVLYRGEPGASIARLTKITEQQFLFDECSGRCTLKLFDMQRRATTDVGEGYMPTYVRKESKILFYAGSGNEKWLLIAPINDLQSSRKVAKAPPTIALPNGLSYSPEKPPVEMSPDEVVLVGEDYHLWIYHVAEAKLTRTNVARCFPVMWRERSHDLICWDWDAKQYSKVNLATAQREQLPQYEDASDLVYLPELDVLVYGKARLHLLISERHDMFVAPFTGGKERKLRSHATISSGFLAL